MNIADKTFVVTGAGNGIGREVALQLLDRGARVAAVDLSSDGLARTAELAGVDASRLTTHALSVTDVDAVHALAQAVIDEHGAVDGLLNVAGIIQKFGPIAQMRRVEIERVMDVNFWGVVTTVQAFLPYLSARPEAAIVNVSSMGGFLPVPGQTAYGASKAAVKLLTEGLHAELQGTNVSVTAVFPGAVATDIKANSGATAVTASEDPKGAAGLIRPIAPAEAARQIVVAMERGRYHAHVGWDAAALDLLVRLTPIGSMRVISKAMSAAGH